MMFFPLYSSTQRVARAELNRPRRFIRFRLGTVWQFLLRAMKLILLGSSWRHRAHWLAVCADRGTCHHSVSVVVITRCVHRRGVPLTAAFIPSECGVRAFYTQTNLTAMPSSSGWAPTRQARDSQ